MCFLITSNDYMRKAYTPICHFRSKVVNFNITYDCSSLMQDKGVAKHAKTYLVPNSRSVAYLLPATKYIH